MGNTTIAAIEIRLVQAEGFSKGWAEFGPKKPPPLVPACLMATSAATGPATDRLRLHLGRRTVDRLGLDRPSKVIGIPLATRKSAMTTTTGTKTNTRIRIRST